MTRGPVPVANGPSSARSRRSATWVRLATAKSRRAKKSAPGVSASTLGVAGRRALSRVPALPRPRAQCRIHGWDVAGSLTRPCIDRRKERREARLLHPRLPGRRLEETLELGVRAGYEGVELRLIDGELIDPGMSAQDRGRVAPPAPGRACRSPPWTARSASPPRRILTTFSRRSAPSSIWLPSGVRPRSGCSEMSFPMQVLPGRSGWPLPPVSGTGGSVVIEAGELRVAELVDEKGDVGAYGGRPGTSSPAGATATADPAAVADAAHQAQLADFLTALDGDGRPLVTGDQARANVAVIRAVYDSARSGQPVVPAQPQRSRNGTGADGAGRAG